MLKQVSVQYNSKFYMYFWAFHLLIYYILFLLKINFLFHLFFKTKVKACVLFPHILKVIIYFNQTKNFSYFSLFFFFKYSFTLTAAVTANNRSN